MIKTIDLNLMKTLMHLQENNLRAYLITFLKKHYDTVIIEDEYLIAAGGNPVCLLAHMDTVFPQPPRIIFHDQEKNVLFSPDGLGADDRAGIYSIIEIVNSGLRPSIIFTTGEEIGGKGASALAEKYKDKNSILPNVKFMIQLDRRGSKDCVFYDCDNIIFTEWIEKYGFKTEFGSFTDICFIAPVWKVAAVNLSVGYLNEHMPTELLFYNYTLETINKVINIIEDAIAEHLPASTEYIPASPFFDRCPICNKPMSTTIQKSIEEYGFGESFICDSCYKEYFGE